MPQSTKDQSKVFVPKPIMQSIVIVLKGISDLLCSNWQTKHGERRECRIDPTIWERQPPEEQFENALYTVEGRENWSKSRVGKYGMPAYLLRSACLTAAKGLEDWDLMRNIRGAFFCDDVIAPITNVKPWARCDSVNVRVRNRGSRKMDKYRAQFDKGWMMTIPA